MTINTTIKGGWGIAASALCFALGLAVGQQAVAGISSTRHNLSSSGTTTYTTFTVTSAGTGTQTSTFGTGTATANHTTNGTAEICVFCHTPHGGQVGNDKPPLWNKHLNAANSYTTYSSTTMDGTSDLTGSVSLACLSCHDGTQAMDNMINAPGSGGYAAGGANQNWSWSVSSTMPSGAVTEIGKDLSNDHPVAIPFCGGGVTGSAVDGTATAAGGTCADADFNGPGGSTGSSNKVYSKKVGTNQVFWVDTATPTKREKTDLMLYSTTNATGPTVECASCHDPHSSTNATFLRISNAGSAVCLTCHNK